MLMHQTLKVGKSGKTLTSTIIHIPGLTVLDAPFPFSVVTHNHLILFSVFLNPLISLLVVFGRSLMPSKCIIF